jgi:signal transduction histidine kinase
MACAGTRKRNVKRRRHFDICDGIVQQEWEAAMSELEYYLRISNHLAGELDIRSALRAVKSEIDNFIEVDHLDVCLIDDEKHCNTSYEMALETSWSMMRSLVSVSPVRSILLGQQDTMITGDALNDARYMFPGAHSDPIRQHGLRSRINVAMKVMGRTVGALNCSSQKTNFYTEENLRQVQTLSDILAPYFFALRASEEAKAEAVRRAKAEAEQEGLRLGARRLTQALESERQRIGMDLHDQTLAELTGISRRLSPDLNPLETAELQSNIQDCIQRLRGIIDNSIPSILELFGFEEAIRSHFETIAGAKPMVVLTFRDQTDGGIDYVSETDKTALFRICQETINNAVTHAEATHLTINVSHTDTDTIAICIKDNGTFKIQKIDRLGGLNHMQTRAELIGAKLDLTKENGTKVTIRLPAHASTD